jgi:ferredoxin
VHRLDGFAVVVDPNAADIARIRDAERGCPTSSIEVVES